MFSPFSSARLPQPPIGTVAAFEESVAEEFFTMITDQTAVQRLSSTAAIGTSHASLRKRQLSAIGAKVRRMSAALSKWVKVPLLPYAPLWEASVIVSLLKERDYFEPDRYATEMPWLTDDWPRV
jgi:hypothetical protein